MDKYIIIIRNNGLSKLKIYEKIRSMGYKIAVFEKGYNNENGFADIVIHVDLTKVDKLISEIVSFTEKYYVASIVSFTEFNLEQSAIINNILSYNGHNLSSIKICRSKYLTRVFTSKNKIPHPKFVKIQSLEDAKEGLKHLELPVIIKPVNLAASYAVSRIDSETELEDKFNLLEKLRKETYLHKYLIDSSEDSWIMEEYIDGFEISVESYTFKGITEVLAIHDKICDVEAPYFFERRFMTPSDRINQDLTIKIKQMTKDILKAVGFSFGLSHVEFRVTKNGPVLVEINPRQGGSLIVDSVFYSTKINMPKILIDMSLGKEPEVNITEQEYSIFEKIFAPNEGEIVETSGFDEALKVENIKISEQWLKPGDKIFNRQSNCVGAILASGKDKNRILESLKIAVSKVNVKVK